MLIEFCEKAVQQGRLFGSAGLMSVRLDLISVDMSLVDCRFRVGKVSREVAPFVGGLVGAACKGGCSVLRSGDIMQF